VKKIGQSLAQPIFVKINAKTYPWKKWSKMWATTVILKNSAQSKPSPNLVTRYAHYLMIANIPVAHFIVTSQTLLTQLSNVGTAAGLPDGTYI
jgi:hypothetical protein